jgi:hypothetical protein
MCTDDTKNSKMAQIIIFPIFFSFRPSCNYCPCCAHNILFSITHLRTCLIMFVLPGAAETVIYSLETFLYFSYLQ